MDAKLAIHPRTGSYSDRWIEYCAEHGVAYTLVNCHASDIISQLASVDALLWHWTHTSPEDVLCAGRVIRAAEALGLKVFPNTATCWHYDDKVAQKYLLEAIGASLVPTYVFYDLQPALQWIDQASFPKVFKLSRGAAAQNVRLVRRASEGRRLARQAFGKGFKPIAGILRDATTKARKHRKEGDSLAVLKRLPKTLWNLRRVSRRMAREKGYVYFQDFLPGNTCDTRIPVVGKRAWGYRRLVRKNSFRASGSGLMDYDPAGVDLECVRMAFQVTETLRLQSAAFDFILDARGKPQILEISYGFGLTFAPNVRGYWDSDLNWHEERLFPQDAILVDLLEQVRQGRPASAP